MGGERRAIPLDRRVCYLGPGVIDIRPSPGAVAGPVLALALGVGVLIALAFFMDRIPAPAAGLLLLVAIVAVTFGGLGTVHSLFGSFVLIDKEKQSVRFQQGLLGLGLGTQELVPFWKIERIELADLPLGEREGRGPEVPFPLRGWELVLVKTSGKRLPLGQVIVPETEELVDEGFARAYNVGDAIASLVGRPLVITAALAEPQEEKEGTP